jgi:hypothetical protein
VPWDDSRSSIKIRILAVTPDAALDIFEPNWRNCEPNELADLRARMRRVLDAHDARLVSLLTAAANAERLMRDQHRGVDQDMYVAHGDRAQAFTEAANMVAAAIEAAKERKS